MSERPTPETDAFSVSFKSIDDPLGKKQWVPVEFTRKLERERDEAKAGREAYKQLAVKHAQERDEARTELEMWRDGNILHEVHRNELEKTERERDEAREQAQRFRSLHYSHLGINGSASWFPWESKLGHE